MGGGWGGGRGRGVCVWRGGGGMGCVCVTGWRKGVKENGLEFQYRSSDSKIMQERERTVSHPKQRSTALCIIII